MKTPFLHLARRLNTVTPAAWFPACLQEATGFGVERLPLPADAGGDVAARWQGALAGCRLAAREDRLRVRHLAGAGALFAAPGYPPLGGVLVLPALTADSPVTAADRLRSRLLARGRALLDAALADPRLLAHIDLGVPAGSIAGAAALQFLRDRHAYAVGHFLLGTLATVRSASGATGQTGAHDTATFPAQPLRIDASSVCVQIAGLPAHLVLWLAAGIAAEAGADSALVLHEDDGCVQRIERQRPAHAQLH